MKTLFVFGTRPEAIKMAPVIKHLGKLSSNFDVKVCVTGQHREMLDQVLELFEISPDHDLSVMSESQSLESLTAKILELLSPVISDEKPDLVLVHGDTTTTMAASIGAFYQKVPVAHVEAGLRTGNIYSPWPEEVNRRVAGVIAKHHFAPTESAKNNLIKEGVDSNQIRVTGNTVIDALLQIAEKVQSEPMASSLFNKFNHLDFSKKMILVTGHRRENFGEGIENLCHSLLETVKNHKDVEVVFPVHLNPKVKEPINKILGDEKSVRLIPPQDYLDFVYLMSKSYMIVSDSGGIQEEAPALGKPVLVTREKTERPEAIQAGTAKLVGSEKGKLTRAIEQLLNDSGEYIKMSAAKNPYGDGKASQKISDYLQSLI